MLGMSPLLHMSNSFRGGTEIMPQNVTSGDLLFEVPTSTLLFNNDNNNLMSLVYDGCY